PLNATIVEEIKAPPPPPPPPKKIELRPPPPPAYVPPPDIPITTAPSESAITMIAPTPPAAPPVIAPPAPPPPPPPPAKPAVVKTPGVASKAGELEYPQEAQRKGIEGVVVCHIMVDEKGNPTDVKIIEARPPGIARYFERSMRETFMQWKFTATGDKYIGE